MRYFGSSFAFRFKLHGCVVLAVSKANVKIGVAIDLGAAALVTELLVLEFIPGIAQRFG